MNDWQRLLSAEGQIVLEAAQALQPTTANLLACHQRLRKQYSDDLVRLALETALLRAKAKGKFEQAARMYFTRTALEQSSGEQIAQYRANRFSPFQHVGDYCCGIGGDAIGLARCCNVVAVDRDAERLLLAKENGRVYGCEERIEWRHGDVLDQPHDVDAIFIDPDRRADGQRHLRLQGYMPNLDQLRQRVPQEFPLGVKVAPGVPWNDLHGLPAEKEFISVAGELKECVLWFGPLQTVSRRATLLPQRATLVGEPATVAEPCEPLAYLYDPDPAVIRAGLVSNLGEILHAQPLDPSIAYLTSTRGMKTPFATTYAIEEYLPFHAKRIGERLQAMNVGHVTITKRGSAVDVDELRRKWKLRGHEQRTVLLTQVMGKPYALIGRVLSSES